MQNFKWQQWTPQQILMSQEQAHVHDAFVLEMEEKARRHAEDLEDQAKRREEELEQAAKKREAEILRKAKKRAEEVENARLKKVAADARHALLMQQIQACVPSPPITGSFGHTPGSGPSPY
jgi:flagellar biosynthesis/type III secretory pathway protein FliH